MVFSSRNRITVRARPQLSFRRPDISYHLFAAGIWVVFGKIRWSCELRYLQHRFEADQEVGFALSLEGRVQSGVCERAESRLRCLVLMNRYSQFTRLFTHTIRASCWTWSYMHNPGRSGEGMEEGKAPFCQSR